MLAGRWFEFLPGSFFFLLHLYFTMTLTRIRSDCQVWSVFTTEPSSGTLCSLHQHAACTQHSDMAPLIWCSCCPLSLDYSFAAHANFMATFVGTAWTARIPMLDTTELWLNEQVPNLNNMYVIAIALQCIVNNSIYWLEDCKQFTRQTCMQTSFLVFCHII